MVWNAANLTSENVALLRTHHRIQIEVYILDSSRRYLYDCTSQLVSGTVDIDVDGETSRFGKMSLLDPQQRLSIDLNGVGWGSNLANRMVQIIYRVWSMDMTSTYYCPIFTGPITDADRDGVMLDLEFKGLESILNTGMLRDFTWPAGQYRSQILMYAAAIGGGIRDYDERINGGITTADWSLEGGENLWERMQDLATSFGANLFFDGNGVMQIRPKTLDPTIWLDSTWLTEEPQFNLDISKLRNVVRIEGGKIPGTDTRMYYEAWPHPTHPFSPQSMARNGVQRIIPHHISDEALTVWDDVIWAAWHNLGWDLIAAETTTAVCPVLPFIEEYDVVNINHPKLYTNAPMHKATIPLVGDAEMTINTFSTTSTGSVDRATGSALTNKGLTTPENKVHGLKNGFMPWADFHPAAQGGKTRGEDWYTGPNGGKGAPNKGGKKKNRKNKGKGGK